ATSEAPTAWTSRASSCAIVTGAPAFATGTGGGAGAVVVVVVVVVVVSSGSTAGSSGAGGGASPATRFSSAPRVSVSAGRKAAGSVAPISPCAVTTLICGSAQVCAGFAAAEAAAGQSAARAGSVRRRRRIRDPYRPAAPGPLRCKNHGRRDQAGSERGGADCDPRGARAGGCGKASFGEGNRRLRGVT